MRGCGGVEGELSVSKLLIFCSSCSFFFFLKNLGYVRNLRVSKIFCVDPGVDCELIVTTSLKGLRRLLGFGFLPLAALGFFSDPNLNLGLSVKNLGFSGIWNFGRSGRWNFGLSGKLNFGLSGRLNFGLSGNLNFGISGIFMFGLSGNFIFGLCGIVIFGFDIPFSLLLNLSAWDLSLP